VSGGGLKSGGVDSAFDPVPLTLMDNHDPQLVAELIGAIEGVASTGAFTGGLFVERFEHAFAEWCETTHAIGVSSGTEALTLVLRALGVKDGDEVIVPANSFIATAEAVSLAGAVPRFADVDPVTQLVTAETIDRASGPRVRGIIPVHLFGRTAEMGEIMALARRWGVWVVEDCAQAHGARYAGRRVGTWGDAGTFSFYPAKNLGAWGDGGAVITADPDIAEHVQLLRSHGERPRYHHRMIGTTGRLDAMQAAVLERKLPRLEGWNNARRRVAASLREAIADASCVAPSPAAQAPCDHVYHQFVVQCSERDTLRAHLERRGIASAIHYPVPIHRSEAYASLAGRVDVDVAPTATKLAGEICSLPIFPTLGHAGIQRIADALAEFDAARSG
jgi:dTDP-3-amino-3,4,6-trideoxy-alpha-D-glucose transaminase